MCIMEAKKNSYQLLAVCCQQKLSVPHSLPPADTLQNTKLISNKGSSAHA